jgi:hypothetical protein
LKRHSVENSGIQERFGRKFVRFRHPSGLLFEMLEDPTDTRAGWTTGEISPRRVVARVLRDRPVGSRVRGTRTLSSRTRWGSRRRGRKAHTISTR